MVRSIVRRPNPNLPASPELQLAIAVANEVAGPGVALSATYDATLHPHEGKGVGDGQFTTHQWYIALLSAAIDGTGGVGQAVPATVVDKLPEALRLPVKAAYLAGIDTYEAVGKYLDDRPDLSEEQRRAVQGACATWEMIQTADDLPVGPLSYLAFSRAADPLGLLRSVGPAAKAVLAQPEAKAAPERKAPDAPVHPPLVTLLANLTRELSKARRTGCGWADGETPEVESVQYVTLDKLAAIVSRSKRSLEKRKSRKHNPLPAPDVEGGGGKPDEWIWATIRAWLEKEFGRKLPERYPSIRA
jgi:hypothetical protein